MADPVTRRVSVVEYDPQWPVQFDALRARLVPVLGAVAVSIEHVGSTAVPHLAAKPMIDVDVVVASPADSATAIEALANLGYLHRGDLGIAGREAFETPAGPVAHHLYVCLKNSAALMNHLVLRDRLRRDPAAAAAYGALKRRLSNRFPDDPELYSTAKTEFVLGLLREEGLPEDLLRSIGAMNTLKP